MTLLNKTLGLEKRTMKISSHYYDMLITSSAVGISADVIDAVLSASGVLLLGFGTKKRFVTSQGKKKLIFTICDLSVGFVQVDDARKFISTYPSIFVKSTRVRPLIDSTALADLVLVSMANKARMRELL